MSENEKVFEYSVGDLAWFVPYGQKRAAQGEIYMMNLDVSPPWVTLMILEDSKYRTISPELLADTAKDAKKIFQGKCDSEEKTSKK